MSNIKLPILSDPATTLKSWVTPLINSISALQAKLTPLSDWQIKRADFVFSSGGLSQFTSRYGKQYIFNGVCHYMGIIDIVTNSTPPALLYIYAPQNAVKDGNIFGSAFSLTLTVPLVLTGVPFPDGSSGILLKAANNALFPASNAIRIEFSGFYEID